MFLAQIGIHPDISYHELCSLFPDATITRILPRLFSVEGMSKSDILSKADTIGGVIRWIECGDIPQGTTIIESVVEKLHIGHEGRKCTFAYQQWGDKEFTQTGFKNAMKIKKLFKSAHGISSRILNQPTWTDIPAAATIGESLIDKGTEIHVLNHNGKQYIGQTIWIQDIDAYSKRDTNKMRSMEVGMLPPKLAQMMINMATGGDTTKSLYDPFCGMGTVLIEGHHMGHQAILGSDVSADMVKATQGNLLNVGKRDSKVVLMDARNMAHTKLAIHSAAIVTEGTLGTIMTQQSIAFSKVEKEIRFLMNIYREFFAGLKKIGFSGTIVMTTPCWHIKESTYSLEGFKDCVLENGFRIEPFNCEGDKKTTLLYHRKGQPVGREVWRINT